ncbi:MULTISPECIES: protein-L-isoaspartate(D-aspartate) O-methyltransferase [unclassified Sphingomonas]|uniref:protein-L-isoaspartate(D-aspartate) O-methyltransferase n=1 Tax=unclassified Sphingomonas TaxID=196159 RepID=UPI00092AB191|nr:MULTISPECIES: protein-L-isoaspartate(D-aspartate) O-methyltransferase [unclassified Sphingomonas]OJU14494.1 MAG: protein-L-isoaspartate O-methyltransferase [Sphingomonas sp. 66-10]
MARAARQWWWAALAATIAAPAAAHKRSDAQAMTAAVRAGVHRAAADADNAELARVLVAMAAVPRDAFVPPALRKQAFADRSLEIGDGQTISAPSVVAVMTAAAQLPPHANVLDVGTGSGYQAAVLARLADRVASVEIVPDLAAAARERLARLGYANVEVRAGDGYAGWPEHAPFDAIIVAAGSDKVPAPLLDQLKVGGRLVMPVGATWASEQLLVVTKTAPGKTMRCSLGWTMFVPLTGAGARDERVRGGVFDTSIPNCFSAPVIAPMFVSAKDEPSEE